MALRSKREELNAAWRALAGYQNAEGWRTIPVSSSGPCQMLAGRHFPGNEEALLVGIASISVPPVEQFPQGSGFLVHVADIPNKGTECIWIALCRQSTGNTELFGMMADDIVITLERQRVANDDRLFHVFISRIRAWQEFMRRGNDGFLSPEAEVGLFGELSFMQELLNAGLPAAVVVDAWQGPLDGSQDFSLGGGAIEVKSTVSLQGFPAKIGTLDQLDDSLIRPLFLAAVRLAINPSGKTLPAIIRETRDHLAAEPAALADLDTRLLLAGYLDTVVSRHTRCFLRTGLRLLPITDNFPRLTQANVAIEIRKARYELDLDLIPSGDVALIDALKQLGVI
jgi:hypothetical protein